MELKIPEIPDDLRIVSFAIFYSNDGSLHRIETTGNLLKNGAPVFSGKKNVTSSITGNQKAQFEAFKVFVEQDLKTKLNL